MTQVCKGKTVDTSKLQPSELFHIDFTFWDVLSHHGFNAVLMIIDAKTIFVWLFCTSSKKPLLHNLWWFFAKIRHEKHALAPIQVDEDEALAKSTAYCKFIRDEDALLLDTICGYASYLNGKIEHPNRTIA
jgi:hypothetical protein